MNLNTDFSQAVVLLHTQLPWVPSPEPGVQRRMLERQGDENGRATSVVQYEAGARFSAHTHDLGEEIMVLQGVLSDEHGSYGTGTYIKNPPGSSHSPFTMTGCTLFVKLGHLNPLDSERVVVNTSTAAWQPAQTPGLSTLPLAQFGNQRTALFRWAPGAYASPHRHYGGEEILVLQGEFEDEHGSHPQGSWLRGPHLSAHSPFSVDGCTMLVKSGHLPVTA